MGIARSRRVKCDEAKPACRRCIDFGRTCEGYAPQNTLSVPRRREDRSSPQGSRRGSSSRLNSPETGSPDGSEDSSAFRSIQQYNVPGQFGYFTSDFWSQLVHRVGHDEPAVQYALSALSAAHTASLELNTPEIDSTQSYLRPEFERSPQGIALQKYNEAIQHLNRVLAIGNSDTTEVILVCCFVFVCTECLFGNPVAAIGHAQAGLKVHRDWLSQGGPFRTQQSSSSPSVANEDYCIWRLCSELENQIWLLTDGQSTTSAPARWEEVPYSVYYSSRDFSTTDQAQLSLDTIAKRQFFLVHENTQRTKEMKPTIPQEMLKEHQVIGRLLGEFESPFRRLVSSIQPREVDRAILLLEMQHLALTIMHKHLFDSSSIEQSTPDFEEVINIGEEILKSIPPLPPSPNAPTTSFDRNMDPNIDPNLPMVKSEMGEEGEASSSGSIVPALYARRIPSFTLATGIIPCLYFTTKACASIPLRKRAIALLYAANCVEGIWSSQNAARSADENLNAELDGTARRPNLGFIPLGRMLGVVGWSDESSGTQRGTPESSSLQLQ